MEKKINFDASAIGLKVIVKKLGKVALHEASAISCLTQKKDQHSLK